MHMFLTESPSLLYVVKPAGDKRIKILASSSQSIPLHECNAQVYVKGDLKLCTETIKINVRIYL